jgi:hypothetical protein
VSDETLSSFLLVVHCFFFALFDCSESTKNKLSFQMNTHGNRICLPWSASPRSIDLREASDAFRFPGLHVNERVQTQGECYIP